METHPLGKKFFANAVDRYTVLYPVKILLTRVNGSVFQREDWAPPIAFNGLGEIEVPKTLRQEGQETRVKEIERAWREK